MTFLTSMREAVAKATGQAAPRGEVNPLVTIGLTEAVLDLELNEEQMFKVVRGFVRQLAAQVHPDKQPDNISALRQTEILKALDYLDDPDRFSLALHDFRTLKAEERREIKVLGATVTALRGQTAELDERAAELRRDRALLTERENAFRRQKNAEALLVPELRRNLHTANQEMERYRNVAAKERAAHQQWLRRFRSLELYFLNLGARTIPKLSAFAFASKWVAVVFLSDDEKAADMTPLDESGEVNPAFLSAAKTAGISKKKVAAIVSAWTKALEQFGLPEKTERKTLKLTLAIFKRTAKGMTVVFGDKLSLPSARIIGSIPAEESAPFTRKDLTNHQGREKIMERSLPLILPGGVLIFASQAIPRSGQWNAYHATTFYSRRMVLAAG